MELGQLLGRFEKTANKLSEKFNDNQIAKIVSSFFAEVGADNLHLFPAYLRSKGFSQEIYLLAHWESVMAQLVDMTVTKLPQAQLNPSLHLIELPVDMRELGICAGTWSLYFYQGQKRNYCLSQKQKEIIELLSENLILSDDDPEMEELRRNGIIL